MSYKIIAHAVKVNLYVLRHRLTCQRIVLLLCYSVSHQSPHHHLIVVYYWQNCYSPGMKVCLTQYPRGDKQIIA